MAAEESTVRREIAGRMAEAAMSLLDTLDIDQRQQAVLPLDPSSLSADSERRTWFYTPADHGGLPLSAMSPDQHRRTHRLLSTGLSRAGYVTAATIMGLENVLDHTEGWGASFGRERGRDPLLYWITLFGTPDETVWGWRFGGHHVSIHHTIIDNEVVSSTPNFLGADPSTSPLLGPHLLRPLAAAEDLGRELVHLLSAEQRQLVVVSTKAPIDIVTVNRRQLSDGDNVLPLPLLFRGRLPDPYDQLMAAAHDAAEAKAALSAAEADAVAFTRKPKGLTASAFSTNQHEVLRALLDSYVDRLPDGLADLEKAKFGGDRIADLSFLWAGGLESGEPHYYRIQGSDLLVEYDNTQRDVNHVHTVWRDLASDFGGDALAAHYRDHQHGTPPSDD